MGHFYVIFYSCFFVKSNQVRFQSWRYSRNSASKEGRFSDLKSNISIITVRKPEMIQINPEYSKLKATDIKTKIQTNPFVFDIKPMCVSKIIIII